MKWTPDKCESLLAEMKSKMHKGHVAIQEVPYALSSIPMYLILARKPILEPMLEIENRFFGLVSGILDGIFEQKKKIFRSVIGILGEIVEE